MKPKWKRTLTPDEYLFMLKEIGERIRNIIYEKAGDNAEKTMRQLGGRNFFKKIKVGDDIDITFTFTLIGNDLIEILGGYERKKRVKRK